MRGGEGRDDEVLASMKGTAAYAPGIVPLWIAARGKN